MRILLQLLLFAFVAVAIPGCSGSRHSLRPSCNLVRHRIQNLNALFHYRCHDGDSDYIGSLRCRMFASKLYLKLIDAQRLGCVNFESNDFEDSSEESSEEDSSSEESSEEDSSSEENDENDEGGDGGDGGDETGGDLDPDRTAACETVLAGQCDVDGSLIASGCGSTGGFCDLADTILCVTCPT